MPARGVNAATRDKGADQKRSGETSGEDTPLVDSKCVSGVYDCVKIPIIFYRFYCKIHHVDRLHKDTSKFEIGLNWETSSVSL